MVKAKRTLAVFLFCWAAIAQSPSIKLRAQDDATPADAQEAVESAELEPSVAKQVDVKPESQDVDISARLEKILQAAGIFQNVKVRVDEGIVFLTGQTTKEEYRQKASDLAGHTQDVVMVVNNIAVEKPSIWDFSSAKLQLKTLARDIIQSTPVALVAFLLLIATWYVAKAMRFLAKSFIEPRTDNAILQRLLVQIFTIFVYLIGVYIVLRIAGLTRLAATVIGGTGLLGLIIGIAFRDIAENFLASLLISLQRPFLPGDVIEVVGQKGVVQNVTTRGTLLMTLDGNHVHIPNSIIYKNVVHNFTANPNTRFDFAVGIDYEDQVADAQEVAIRAVRSHHAVLDDPEPHVIVESLGAATVNLRIYFWVNTRDYDGLKVRSATIRKVKAAFVEADLTMPDEAREIIFPKGVPVQILKEITQPQIVDLPESPKPKCSTVQDQRDASSAEGGLHSEADTLKQQAKQSRDLTAGTELLDADDEQSPDAASPISADPIAKAP